MALLSDADLAQVRAEAELTLSDTCQIIAPTTIIDSAGGRSTTWAARATVACRYAGAGSAQELEMAARLGVTAPYFFSLPAGTAIASKERLAAGDHTFEVVYGFPVGTYLTAVRVLAKEIL